jgi:molecular chaperone DnaK
MGRILDLRMILGIDLGTTNTVCAVYERGEARILPTLEGGRLLPSVVAFTRYGERAVGDVARRMRVVQPDRTIHSAKRFIGRLHKDAAEDIALVRYEVVPTRDGVCGFRVDDRIYSPAEISAAVLQRVRQAAESDLGTAVTEAVITVPAHFNDRQRQATRDAAAIAGLTVARILNEPTAAALAWLAGRRRNATIVVYDFGGGTFDVSVVRIEGDVAEVRATRGDNTLGGNDIDAVVERHFLDAALRDGVDLSGDPVAGQRLREAAEAAKIDLSTATETHVRLPFLAGSQEKPYHFEVALTRRQLETLLEPFVARTLTECEQVLREAGLSRDAIDDVAMVGGTSRIPRVRAAVGGFFGRNIDLGIHPDEAVAMGAALHAGTLAGEGGSVTLVDVTSFSLGVEVSGGRFARLIAKNAVLPAQRVQTVTTAADNQSTVRIHVLQGESAHASDNTSLGEFELTGIAPGPKGSARIEVSFGVDTSGIVHVSAVDTRSGSREAIRIEAPNTMARADLERLRAESEALSRPGAARRGGTRLASLVTRVRTLRDSLVEGSLEREEAELFLARAERAQGAESAEAAELESWADRLLR